MWMAGSLYKRNASTPGYIEANETASRSHLWGKRAKIHLPELLYSCLNASFFGNPNSDYGEDNPHSAVRWPQSMPIELLEILYKRHQSGGEPQH